MFDNLSVVDVRVLGMQSGDGMAGVAGVDTPFIADADLHAMVVAAETAITALAERDSSSLTNADRRALMMRMETIQRALVGVGHGWTNELVDQHGLDVYPGSVPQSLAIMMRITPRKAADRIRVARQVGSRMAMTGERLPAEFAATAAAQRSGVLDAAHVGVILSFFRHLPDEIDAETRLRAEKQLVEAACTMRPDQLALVAARLDAFLNPDGDFDPDDQQNPRRRRDPFFYLGEQGPDGMSEGSFCVDAEFRAYLEALFAKWARPGMCNPDDPRSPTDDSRTGGDSVETEAQPEVPGSKEQGSEDPGPVVPGSVVPSSEAPDEPDAPNGVCTQPAPTKPDGTGGAGAAAVSGAADGPQDHVEHPEPFSQENPTDPDKTSDHDDPRLKAAAARDLRGQKLRQHDALKAVVRQMLASGSLGQHRGLPVTAIITMTSKELESASGVAVTGTGSLVPMRDAIRMASHAHHYLAIFDDAGRAIHLGRSKRIASADQRIVLIARERGCSFPNCARPATWCQVHHVDEWADGGCTDIDSLTLACDAHHPLVGDGPGKWTTTKAGPDHPYAGRTLWTAPVDIDPRKQGYANHFHHPEEILYPPEDPPPETNVTEPQPDRREAS